MSYDINTPLTVSQGLNFVRVDALNLHQALEIQHRIWPDNPVDDDYESKAYDHDDDTNVSWLVYHRNTLIGLTGVFTFDPDEPGYDEASIWMDWYAILPEYRGQHYGEQVLLATIDYARQLGRFKYFRLDTTDYPNRVSTILYDKLMPLCEAYTAEPMPTGHLGLIYSCSLSEDPSAIRPWDNQFLNLGYYNAAEITVN